MTVPYPTDPNRPPSNSVGEGGTPPPEDDSAFLPSPDYGVPPGPAQVGQWPVYGAPGNTSPADIPGMIGLPTFPGMGFIPRGGSVHNSGYPFDADPYGAPGPRWGDYGRDGGPAVPDSYWDDRSGEDDEPDDWERDEQSLFAHDPDRYLPESEVEESHHHLQHPHYDDYDKALNDFEHEEEHRTGAIRRQADQWPFRVAWGNPFNPHPKKPKNKTEPPATRNDEVRIMRNEESGLGYDAIVRWNSEHGSYDVLKPLE